MDSNVLVAALLSRRGASFRFFSLLDANLFQLNLSVPLVLEYEHAARKVARTAGLSYADIDDVLDYVCATGNHHEIFFLWRPFLPDPDDDMVLELAANSRSRFIITHNVRDFHGAEQFEIDVVTPRAYLQLRKVIR